MNQSRYAEKSFAKKVEVLTKTIEGHEKSINNKIKIIESLSDKAKNAGNLNETEKFKIDIVINYHCLLFVGRGSQKGRPNTRAS